MDLNSLVSSSIADTLGSLAPFAPELIICAWILGLLLVRLLPFGEKLDAGLLTLLGTAVALYYGGPWSGTAPLGEAGAELFGGMLVYDSFTVGVRAILLAFTILFVIFTMITGVPAREDGTDFYCLILGAVLGMCLMVSANHLLMIFLAVEMASVPSYALAGIMRGQRPASEAALKYSIYGAGAAGVMLYGISLLAGLVNTVHLPSIALALSSGLAEMSRPEQLVLIMAGLMIGVGLAFKLSAVPFHFWCPDIFEGATAEIGAFLSIASKAAALALLIRVCLGIGMVGPDRITAADLPKPEVTSPSDDASDDEIEVAAAKGENGPGLFLVEDDLHAEESHGDGSHDAHSGDMHEHAMAPMSGHAASDPLAPVRGFIGVLISVLAAVTVTFGNLAAYAQTNIKRLLAYSTIAHAGYMLMPVPAALAVATVDAAAGRDAISAIVLYAAIYAFMNLGAFACVAFLRNSMNTEEIADYGGLIKRAPFLVVCLALILFSLVGLPPLAGFIGKFALFASLADAFQITGQKHLMILLIIGGINTAISLFYYVRVVKVMVIDAESEHLSKHTDKLVGPIGLGYLGLVTLPIVLLIVNWNDLAGWTSEAASQLFG